MANCAVVRLNQIEPNDTFALSSCCINMASEKCIRGWQCDCCGVWVWGLRKAKALCVSDPETRDGGRLLEGVGLSAPEAFFPTAVLSLEMGDGSEAPLKDPL